jgi:hypothetical protein
MALAYKQVIEDCCGDEPEAIPDDTFIGIGPDGKRWTAGELRAEARREAEQAEADAWYKAELERMRERAPA